MKLITFETAKIAKEKGFKELCYSYYNKAQVLTHPYLENGSSSDIEFRVDLEDLLDNYNKTYSDEYSAPYQSHLQTWLRDKQGIRLFVIPSNERYTYFIIHNNKNVTLDDSELNPGIGQGEPKSFESYEDALEIGLLTALRLI